eukprot:scaffold12956_cov71-Cyclotella_meneghiniana.AAC.7
MSFAANLNWFHCQRVGITAVPSHAILFVFSAEAARDIAPIPCIRSLDLSLHPLWRTRHDYLGAMDDGPWTMDDAFLVLCKK